MSLEARDVSYRYDPKSWVFQQMNMQVKQGEVVGLWGPSGCGKTSLGRILAGYAEPVAGQVLLDGNTTPTYRSISGSAGIPASGESCESTLANASCTSGGVCAG